MALSVSHTHTQGSDADASSYTFTGASIGTASSDRKLLVFFSCRISGAGSTTVTGLTVAGNAATKILDTHDSTVTSILTTGWLIDVPTGTTADIVATLSAAGSLRAAVHVYRITGTDVIAVGACARGTASQRITRLDGGALVAAAGHVSSAAISWTVVTADGTVLTDSNTRFACGSVSGLSGLSQSNVVSGLAADGAIAVVSLVESAGGGGSVIVVEDD